MAKFRENRSAIMRNCDTKSYSEKDCLEVAKSFDMNDKFKEYVELYKILNGK